MLLKKKRIITSVDTAQKEAKMCHNKRRWRSAGVEAVCTLLVSRSTARIWLEVIDTSDRFNSFNQISNYIKSTNQFLFDTLSEETDDVWYWTSHFRGSRCFLKQGIIEDFTASTSVPPNFLDFIGQTFTFIPYSLTIFNLEQRKYLLACICLFCFGHGQSKAAFHLCINIIYLLHKMFCFY